MKRIKMKNNTTKFVWDGDNCVDKYTELIEQYYYDSKEERMEYKKEMESKQNKRYSYESELLEQSR